MMRVLSLPFTETCIIAYKALMSAYLFDRLKYYRNKTTLKLGLGLSATSR